MRRLAIAFFYDESGIVDDYLLHLVGAMSRFVEWTIFVSNGPLTKQSETAIGSLVQEVMVRENVDFDVGGYKAAIEKIGYQALAGYDEIILYNHTFYGPIFPLDEMFGEMGKRDCDFWGITDHREVVPNPFTNTGILHRHLQSHFLAIRKSMVGSGSFRHYWESLPPITSYIDSIVLHESRFTHHFEQLGYRSSVYVDADDYGSDNPSFINVEETIERRCPILKRRIFFHDPTFHDEHAIDLPRALRLIKKHSEYDLELIWRNIVRTAEPGALAANAACLSIFPDIRLKGGEQPPNVGKLAVCAHVYYADMAAELAEQVAAMPVGFDLIITTDTDDKKREIERAFANAGNIDVLIVRVVEVNRGRDMAAMFVACRDLFADDRYDLVCRLHTKKSPQDGAARARLFKHHLLDNLMHSRGYVANLLDMFADHPSIGVAIPPIVHKSYPTLGHAWFTNRGRVEQTAERLGIRPRLDPNTPVAAYGGMYWFRPRALRKLFAYPWRWDDFDPEPIYGDGDLPHALERLICYAAQDAGYRTQQIMCTHQAEQQYTALEFKTQRLCAMIPAGDFRTQSSLLMQWMIAGHPISPPAAAPPPPPPATETPPPAADPERLAALAAALSSRSGEAAVAEPASPAPHSASNGVLRNGARTSLLSRLVPRIGGPGNITLADQARGRGEWELAAGHYHDALRRNPANPAIWVQYGHALKESGRLDEAEAAYRRALAYDESDADRHLQLGHVLKVRGRAEEAEQAYLRAFALDAALPGVVSELRQFGWTDGDLTELHAMLTP